MEMLATRLSKVIGFENTGVDPAADQIEVEVLYLLT
jgi:hypothetical protein